MRRSPRYLLLLLALALAACDREPEAPVQGQRIALDRVGAVEQPLPSPDTKGASWTVADNGQSIDFGPKKLRPGQKPWLSLACRVKADPPTVRIVRHVTVRPGEKALFPVIGNGTISRFKVDATLRDGEWRWEGEVPADDALLEVFTGRREIEATLPGAGSLIIAGSSVPGQFIDWCRKGGETAPPRPEPRETAQAGTPPA